MSLLVGSWMACRAVGLVVERYWLRVEDYVRGDFISERFKGQQCDQAGRMRVTPRDPAGVNRLYSTIVLDFCCRGMSMKNSVDRSGQIEGGASLPLMVGFVSPRASCLSLASARAIAVCWPSVSSALWPGQLSCCWRPGTCSLHCNNVLLCQVRVVDDMLGEASLTQAIHRNLN